MHLLRTLRAVSRSASCAARGDGQGVSLIVRGSKSGGRPSSASCTGVGRWDVMGSLAEPSRDSPEDLLTSCYFELKGELGSACFS